MRSRRSLAVPLVVAFLAAVLAACGGGDKKAASEPVKTQTGPAWSSSQPTTTTKPGARKPGNETKVKLDVPPGWSTPKPHRSKRIWPAPVKVLSSFRIARVPENAACPYEVLKAMPPDGIYVLVSEYTKPRPTGFPPIRKLGPRPDLRKLDLRPAEVECWDEGLSGSADFAERGRSFHVEVLLGAKVTKAQRERALNALASLKIA